MAPICFAFSRSFPALTASCAAAIVVEGIRRYYAISVLLGRYCINDCVAVSQQFSYTLTIAVRLPYLLHFRSLLFTISRYARPETAFINIFLLSLSLSPPLPLNITFDMNLLFEQCFGDEGSALSRPGRMCSSLACF